MLFSLTCVFSRVDEKGVGLHMALLLIVPYVKQKKKMRKGQLISKDISGLWLTHEGCMSAYGIYYLGVYVGVHVLGAGCFIYSCQKIPLGGSNHYFHQVEG